MKIKSAFAILFLSLFFLDCKDKTTDSSADPGSKGSEAYYIFTKTSLNLRAQGDKNSASLGQIPRGSQLKVLEKSGNSETIEGMAGNWWKVEVDGKTGFMFSAYISRYKPSPKECYAISNYLNDIYGEIKEGNSNLVRYKHEKNKACDIMDEMESCKATEDFELKSGVSGKLTFGHEWMNEEISFPGMADTEGYLLLRDCCGDKEKPFTYQQFMDVLDKGKKFPEMEAEFYQTCSAKRKSGGLVLGQESGL
jgi:hypothetical protein